MISHSLAQALSKELLSLSACAKVETDAFDRTILAVLVQEGRPVAFESWKLNETEQRFTVHEKEMTAVVHCLRLWRHYLLGGKFEIQTDNVAMSYFDTQNKLRPKQARWQVGRV
nr:ribonuclease H family protein [Candidatus Frankia nodulisporulans]